MHEDSNQGLSGPCRVDATREDRTQTPLVCGDLAFDEPPLQVEAAGKAPTQGAAERSQRPFASAVATIQADDALGDAKDLEGELEIGFGVVAGISQDAVQGRTLMSLGDERTEVRRVAGRPQSYSGREEKRGLEIGYEGNLDPAGSLEFSRGTAVPVVVADVAGIEAGGVDGGDGLVGDQATFAGGSDDGVEEGVEGPFFLKRCSATQRVE